jgi:hypothetical protein
MMTDMEGNSLVRSGDSGVISPLPPRGKPVWVQCRNFKCLAFQEGGKWKSYFERKELPGEVTIISDMFK